MKFDLWDCERKRFPPWVLIVWVGFTKIGTCCDVPDRVFGLYFRHFFYFDKIGKSSTSWISRALECRPQNGLLIAPPKLPWKITFFWYVERSKKGEKKQHLWLEVFVSGNIPGCIWLSERSSSPREKLHLDAGENWILSVARTRKHQLTLA